MKQTVICFLICLTLIFSSNPVLSQTPAPQQQSEDRIVSGTTEVVLDAVVRDKKGRAVKDLQASDFQVFEDGKPQDVRSFRLVTGEMLTSSAANTTSPTATRRDSLE